MYKMQILLINHIIKYRFIYYAIILPKLDVEVRTELKFL